MLLISSAAGAAVVEKIAATVDGEAVTSSDLSNAIKIYGPEIQKDQNVSGTELKAKVLDMLIDDKVVENQMKREEAKGMLKVEPHEVDSRIDNILRSSRIPLKIFEEELAKKGMTLEKYKHELHNEILRGKFISNNVGRKVNISERELKDYFDKNMDEFKSVSSVKLSQISIPFTENSSPADLEKMESLAIKIADAAKTSTNFELLAKEFNGKPFPVQGGSFGIVAVADLQPSIAQMASQLEIGQASGPIITNAGVHIIKVLDRAKTSAKDFTSVRDRVYDVVYQIKMESTMREYVQQLRKKAYIDIKNLGL